MTEHDEPSEFEYTQDPSKRQPPGSEPETAEQRLRIRAERVNLERVLRDVLEHRVSAAVDAAITGRIEREVNAIFEQGWVATNQWGEPENNSKPVTIRSRIAALLSKKERYDSRSTVQSVLKKAIEKAVEAAVETERREFQKELKAWKSQKMSDKLRAALDGSIF